MKHLKQKLAWMMLAVIAMIAPMAATAPQAQGQTDMDLGPGLVISLASIEEQLSDIEYLMEASGFGQFGPFVRMSAGEFVRGIDMSKPLGIMLFFESGKDEPDILAFIPVDDIDDVLDTIAQYVDIDEEGDLITLITDTGEEFLVKESNGFAFVSTKEELLDELPANPIATLEGMEETYNLAAKIYGQRIPEELREKGLEMIREGYLDQIEQLEDVNPAQAEMQRKNYELTMAQFDSFVNETDEVLAGLSIDKDGEHIFVDMQVVGLPGSTIANQAAAGADAPTSEFAGFLLEGAAMSMHGCTKFDADYIEPYEQMIDSVREEVFKELENEGNMTDEQREHVRALFDGLVDVVKETMAEGVIDMGAMVNLDEGLFEAAMGMRVANGTKLEDSLRQMAEIAAEEAEGEVEFKFNADSAGGVNFHEITMAIPDSEPEAQDIFGDTLNVLIGTSETKVYLAAGEDPRAILNKCVNGSGPSDLPLMQYNIHIAPILRFFAALEDEEMMGVMADTLAETGKDRLQIVADYVENGQSFRIDLEDGILSLIQVASESMGGAFGGPPQDF